MKSIRLRPVEELEEGVGVDVAAAAAAEEHPSWAFAFVKEPEGSVLLLVPKQVAVLKWYKIRL